MKIALIFFSLYLFATEVHIKFNPTNNKLYLYIKTYTLPKSYKFPNLSINGGDIKYIKDFKYLHNDYFYIGKEYLVIPYNNYLEISPIKVKVNKKTLTTKKLIYNLNNTENLALNININHQKSLFLTILVSSIALYLISLFLLYLIKINKVKEKIGYFDNDIKKFYYFLALNKFNEIEELNKDKNIFKKNIKDFDELAHKIIKKAVNSKKFYKEFINFSIILIIIFIIKVIGN